MFPVSGMEPVFSGPVADAREDPEKTRILIIMTEQAVRSPGSCPEFMAGDISPIATGNRILLQQADDQEPGDA
jgi:hypothetical protein